MGRSDVELAEAVAGGDRGAAEELAGRLLERVRCACRYMAGAHSDWEDMVQIVMIEILRSAGTFVGESTLESWAGTITMRTLWRRIRSRERYREVIRLFRESRIEPPPARGGTAEEQVDIRVIRSRIAHCLDRINANQRVCLVMKFVFDHSVKEIAQVTGAPENTVKDRLKNGKEKLRRFMMGDELLKEYVGSLKP